MMQACSPLNGQAISLFFTLVAGPRRSLSLKLSDKRVYEPQIRARLGTTAHLCEVVVLKPPHNGQVMMQACSPNRTPLPDGPIYSAFQREVLSLNRPESLLTNPPGHLWRDKWTAPSGPLSRLPPEPSTLNCEPLHFTPYTLHPAPYTLHPTP